MFAIKRSLRLENIIRNHGVEEEDPCMYMLRVWEHCSCAPLVCLHMLMLRKCYHVWLCLAVIYNLLQINRAEGGAQPYIRVCFSKGNTWLNN